MTTPQPTRNLHAPLRRVLPEKQSSGVQNVGEIKRKEFSSKKSGKDHRWTSLLVCLSDKNKTGRKLDGYALGKPGIIDTYQFHPCILKKGKGPRLSSDFALISSIASPEVPGFFSYGSSQICGSGEAPISTVKA
uniref:Uncharacterized protein n=2 Tax=Meloidogyne TaxID=189290 RepID=A0A6V7U1Z0_MELEN|nr:unnamed protein product [Meloidogyne enterolobii]